MSEPTVARSRDAAEDTPRRNGGQQKGISMTENRVPLALAQRVEDDWWAMSEPAAPEALQGAIEAHLDELAALVAPPQPEPVARETLRVGDRVRIVSEAVLTTIDECGESWDGNSPDSSTTYYLLDRPDPLAKYLRNVVECYLDDEDQDNLVADLVAKLRAPGAPPVEPEPVNEREDCSKRAERSAQ